MAWKKDMKQLDDIIRILEEKTFMLTTVDKGTRRVLRGWIDSEYVVVATAQLSYWVSETYETKIYIEQGPKFFELLRTIVHDEIDDLVG